MLVDHLFQYRISPWPKTAEKRGFCTCVTDIPTDGRMDGRTDGRTDPVIEMHSWRTHLKKMKKGLVSPYWLDTARIIPSFPLAILRQRKKANNFFLASFCLIMGLNHRKFVWKLCQKCSKCDVFGHCSFIRLEMAKVWRKKSLIQFFSNDKF